MKKKLLLTIALLIPFSVHAATVVKTIGTNARDYSTMQSWEDQLDNGAIYAAGDVAEGDVYKDSSFDEALTVDGGGTIGLTSVLLTVPSSERHTGIAGTGARLVASVNRTITINAAVTFTMSWIEFDGNAKNLTINNSTSNTITRTFDHLIIHDATATSNVRGIQLASNSPARLMNSIVYDIVETGSSTGVAEGIRVTNTSTNRPNLVYNCTVDRVVNNAGTGNALGINFTVGGDISQNECKNCISTSTSGTTSGTIADFASTSNVTYSNNLSSDTTATGTGSLTSKSASNQFVSVTNGSENYHLKAGADAIDAGTDLATTPSGVQFDIDNYDRDTTGVTWDMGADEYVAAVASGGRGLIDAIIRNAILRNTT